MSLIVIIMNIICYSMSFSLKMSSTSSSNDNLELKKCLMREYNSFFSPMEQEYYNNNVQFIDPLNNLEGIDKYQKNVDMLAGRTSLGNFLFKDASIQLHNVETLNDGRIQTRWTLRVTIKAVPWQPTPRFTGVSIYTLNDDGKISKQEDYWDSINLFNGQYKSVGLFDGISDFIGQIQQDNSAEMVAPELPYELLRRGKEYDVRRYPKHVVAETIYDQRPEGYDRLGSYVQGSNEKDTKITYYSPTVMRITDEDSKRIKRMTWPLSFAAPGGELANIDSFPEPNVAKIKIKESESITVAVLRFEVPATEPVVRGYTGNLIKYCEDDGMTVASSAKEGECLIGQYDALFSLNKRRNEVWVQLDQHPWM